MHDMGRSGVKPDSLRLASAPCPRVQIERASSSSYCGAWKFPVSAQALPHLLAKPQVLNPRSSSLFEANKAKDVPVDSASRGWDPSCRRGRCRLRNYRGRWGSSSGPFWYHLTGATQFLFFPSHITSRGQRELRHNVGERSHLPNFQAPHRLEDSHLPAGSLGACRGGGETTSFFLKSRCLCFQASWENGNTCSYVR